MWRLSHLGVLSLVLLMSAFQSEWYYSGPIRVLTMVTVKLEKDTGFFALSITDDPSTDKAVTLKDLYKCFGEIVDQLSSVAEDGEKGCAFSQNDISYGYALLASARVLKHKNYVVKALSIVIEEEWSGLILMLLGRTSILFEKLQVVKISFFESSKETMEKLIQILSSLTYYPGLIVAVFNDSNYEYSLGFVLLYYIIRKKIRIEDCFLNRELEVALDSDVWLKEFITNNREEA